MLNPKELILRDLEHFWHPCTQMKDFESYLPFLAYSANGSYIRTNEGDLIDGISSWWCKSLGHRFPAVVEAINKQLETFDHIITANATYENIILLTELLSELTQKKYTFFASDGSCAVEIAMKIAIFAKELQGFKNNKKFIALKNSYHGETLATLSVSDLGLYKKSYENLGVDCNFLQNIPYVSSVNDPLWSNCEILWQDILPQLERLKPQVCALIIEPIVQGAGGMLFYSQDFLKKLRTWTLENNIFLIADEIMTGLGRTGEWLACNHAQVTPDLLCLSKGLTSGALPLSVVMLDEEIYTLFYDDYEKGKSFLHSHTYSGNPLAVSAALATLKSMQKLNINNKANKLGAHMLLRFKEISEKTGKITNIRSIGAIVAGEFVENNTARIGFKFSQAARKRGALLRPLGSTLYWLPPLTTDFETIDKLTDITLDSLNFIYNNEG